MAKITTRRFGMQLLLWLLALLLSSPIYATTPSEKLTALLSSFKGMSAQFKQVVEGGKNNPSQTSTGQMALERPGKFRWEVKQPNSQVLIADGRYLWIYDVDLEQATRQKLDFKDTNSPASLLSGSVGSLSERFQVTDLPNSSHDNLDNSAGFRLKPRGDNDIFQWIDMYFTQGKLRKMLLKDNLGSLNTFYFSQVQTNPVFKMELFQFKPPKGVEVIKN